MINKYTVCVALLTSIMDRNDDRENEEDLTIILNTMYSNHDFIICTWDHGDN